MLGTVLLIVVGAVVILVNYLQNKQLKSLVDARFPRVPIELERLAKQMQALPVEGKKVIDEFLAKLK